MLKPAGMARVIITGLQRELEAATETLEGLNLLHLVTPASLEEGFTYGSPLGYGAKVSELLLEVRGLAKILGVEAGDPAHPYPAAQLAAELEEKLAELAPPLHRLQEQISQAGKTLEETRQRAERLTAFQGLDLDLADLTGYRSLEVFVGLLDPEALVPLTDELPTSEIITTEAGLAILFVPAAQAQEAARLLAGHGFKAQEPPAAAGRPSELLAEARRQISELDRELEALNSELEALATRHGAWLAAAEEYLAIEAAKSELPLSLTSSAHAFLLEGWVPTDDLERLQKALAPHNLHLEVSATEAALPAVAAGEHSGEAPEEQAEQSPEEPPVKLDNPAVTRPFELFINLFNTPRHSEVDPTVLLWLFYPLFFGLMVGDAGYGLGYFLLGGWIVKRYHYHEQLASLGKIMRLAGVWTIFFGLILYAEVFGMSFIEVGGRLGLDIKSEFESEFLTRLLGYTFLWPLHKFDSSYVIMMIKVTLLIGGVHLTLGRLLGFRNHLQNHTLGQAVNHNISWILLFWVLIALLFWLLKALTLPVTGWFVVVGLAILALVMLIAGEGGIAVVEIPTALSNLISYTRILALGLSDAGLAFAFNTLGLDVVGGSGGFMLIPAFLVLLMGHLMIFMLGIIGAGIHSLRLQYVEFFTKFYQGGGTPFRPFGSQRKYITQT